MGITVNETSIEIDLDSLNSIEKKLIKKDDVLSKIMEQVTLLESTDDHIKIQAVPRKLYGVLVMLAKSFDLEIY